MKPHQKSMFAATAMATLATLATLVGTPTVQAQTQTQTKTPAGCAQVEVQNVRPQQGHLMLAAYGDAESYNKTALTSVRMPAAEAVMRFAVCGLSGTEVALALYQDLDNDGKMGRNLIGIPTEPWGSSGKPSPMGPTWASGRVPLDGKTIMVMLSN